MSRYRSSILLSLCLLTIVAYGAVAQENTSITIPNAAEITALRQQLADANAEISRLTSSLNAYKMTRTGNDLLQLFMTERQVWTGTIDSRHDSDDGTNLYCAHESQDLRFTLQFDLQTPPGDLTVGDEIQFTGMLRKLPSVGRYGRPRIDLKDVTDIQRIEVRGAETEKRSK